MCKFASAFAIAWLFIASPARADMMKINTSLGDLHGVGSFNTDGVCQVCTPSDGLSNFVFALNDDPLNGDKLTYFRATNSLSGAITGEDESRVLFTPSGNLQFKTEEDDHTVVFHGQYSIAAAAAVADAPLPVQAAADPLAVVPEPGASVLLASALTALAVGRFLRSRSARKTFLPR